MINIDYSNINIRQQEKVQIERILLHKKINSRESVSLIKTWTHNQCSAYIVIGNLKGQSHEIFYLRSWDQTVSLGRMTYAESGFHDFFYKLTWIFQ